MHDKEEFVSPAWLVGSPAIPRLRAYGFGFPLPSADGSVASRDVGSYVICGFKRVGQAAAKAILSHRKIEDNIVIERDFTRLESARLSNFRTVFGDPSKLRTMRIAQVGIARDVVIRVGGPGGSEVVKTARKVAPSAHIRAGIATAEFRDALIAAGADDVIVISDEAGVLLARSLHA